MEKKEKSFVYMLVNFVFPDIDQFVNITSVQYFSGRVSSELGRRSSGPIIFATFGIGITVADFQS